MLNFMLTTSIYVVVSMRDNYAKKSRKLCRGTHVSNPCLQISYRLFELTGTLKTAFVPSKDNKRLIYNVVVATAISTVLYSLSFLFLKMPRFLVRYMSVLKEQILISLHGLAKPETREEMVGKKRTESEKE